MSLACALWLAVAPALGASKGVPVAGRPPAAVSLPASAIAPPRGISNAGSGPVIRFSVSADGNANNPPSEGAPESASSQLQGAAAAAGDLGGVIDKARLRPQPDEKSLETIKPLDLHPMQIPVGMREVNEKEERLRSMKDKERERWFKSRPVPYVLRRGKRRPVDRHHETRAAWQAGVDELYAYSYVAADEQAALDGLSEDDFWKEMLRLGWFYPYDQTGGGPHPARLLPEDTRGHADDPYRSLAYYVRRAGGFDKTTVPFAEFRWANFFRARLKSFPRGKKGYDDALAEALVLAKSPEARDLPGYNGSGAK